MAALLSFLPAAGHDQLWFLLMARRWLAGATLYGPQIFDSNTPAVVWLSAIPVALADHLHLPTIAVAKLLVFFLEAAIATLSLRLLRRLAPCLPRAHVLWLAFSFILIFACAPARDLGQRDHLTALLCLPYVLAAAADVSTIPALSFLRLAAGTLAAIGICLKPQQTLIPLTLELTLLLQANLGNRTPRSSTAPGFAPTTDRSTSNSSSSGSTPPQIHTASLRRPEPWLLLLIALAFVAAVHHRTPLFFSLTLPTLLSTYWAIGHLAPLQLLTQAPNSTSSPSPPSPSSSSVNLAQTPAAPKHKPSAAPPPFSSSPASPLPPPSTTRAPAGTTSSSPPSASSRQPSRSNSSPSFVPARSPTGFPPPPLPSSPSPSASPSTSAASPSLTMPPTPPPPRTPPSSPISLPAPPSPSSPPRSRTP